MCVVEAVPRGEGGGAFRSYGSQLEPAPEFPRGTMESFPGISNGQSECEVDEPSEQIHSLDALHVSV